MCHMAHIMCHVSCVMCHMSCVMCQVLRVIYHLSLTQTVTATDPPPANSPIMRSRQVHKDTQKQNKNVNTQIIIDTTKTQKRLEVQGSLIRGLQSTRMRVLPQCHTHTNRQTPDG